jgi:hypothetical protein
MIDFKLTLDGELDLSNGLSLVSDLNQLEQNLRSRLRTFYGEWVFDTSRGVKYYEEILIKSPDPDTVDGILKSTILETIGVVEITNYTSEFNDTTRELSVSVELNTIYGSLVLEEVLP